MINYKRESNVCRLSFFCRGDYMRIACLFVYVSIFVGIIFMIKDVLVRMKSKKYDNKELKEIILVLSIINIFILGLVYKDIVLFFIKL